MENPIKQKVEVKHSESKTAWNIIGTTFGGKYKIARIPYHQINKDGQYNTQEKSEALETAKFIAYSINK